MSTINVNEVYPGSSVASQAPLEIASAGGPSPESGKLPLAAWAAFVVVLFVVRLLWDYSE